MQRNTSSSFGSLRSSKFTRLILAGSAAALLSVVSASAANLYWDATNTTVDSASQGGNGTWTTDNWDNGTSEQLWADGNDAFVTTAVPSVITIGATPVVANSLTLDAAGTSTVTIKTDGTAGRSLTLANGATINAGTLQFGQTGGGTAGRINLTIGGNITGAGTLSLMQGVTLKSADANARTISSNVTIGQGDGTAAVYFDSTSTGVITLAGTVGSDASQRGISVTGQANITGGITATGANSISKTGTGTLTVTGSGIKYDAGTAQAINGGTLEIGGAATMTGGTTAGTFASGVTIGTSAALKINSTANQTISGVISGAGALVKDNTGTLSLNAQSTYTGGTTVNGGVLDLTGGGGASGTIRGTATVNTGGTLRLSTGDATGYNTDATRLSVINLNGGTLNVNTTANQTLGSAVINMTGASITGIAGSNIDLFANGSAINTLASATTSTISLPTMNLRQNDTVFTVADGAAATDLLISAALGNGSAGNHNLIKNGAGTMRLTANNTATGSVTINGGVLDVASNGLYRNSDGSAAYNNAAVVTVNTGGTLRLGSFEYNGNGGLGGLRDYAAARVLNGGTIEVTGVTQSSGQDFTVNATGGTFRYNPADVSNTLTLTGTANDNIKLNGALTVDALGNIAINEVMETGSGTGSITKTGAGMLTLGAANTYAGPTTVNAGSLQVTGSTAAGSAVAVNNAAVLRGTGTVGGAVTLNGTSSMQSSGTLTLTNGFTAAGTNAITTGIVAGNGTVNSGASLIVNGTLSGTQVVNGTLLANGSGTITGGTATVNSGGVIGGNGDLTTNAGTINSATTVNSGGILRVGSTAGLTGDGVNSVDGLVVGNNLNLAAGGTIQLTLGGAISGTPNSILGTGNNHAVLYRTGGVWTFNPNQSFSFVNAQAGTFDNIILGLSGTETGLLSGNSWDFSDASFHYAFSYDAGEGGVDLTVMAVPEPGTWAMMLGGLGMLLGWQRSRRRTRA